MTARGRKLDGSFYVALEPPAEPLVVAARLTAAAHARDAADLADLLAVLGIGKDRA